MKTVERAAQVLKTLAGYPHGAGISELRARTGLALATLHRILQAWSAAGFVAQDPETRCYRLGLRAMELGLAVWEGIDLQKAARPVMERLALATRESVYLCCREEDERVVIDCADGWATLRLQTRVGRRDPLWVGSSGRVLLAHLPPEETAAVIGRAAPGALTMAGFAPYRLQRRLEQIRRRGYDVSFSEVEPSTAGVSAPVWDARGEVTASLMVGGPDERFTSERLDTLVRLTIAAARDISMQMCYVPAQQSDER